ncbi:MAG: hypothetical protein P4L92_22920 [Rudaea sp.]|nr:hypothetical protein [Rudaea sp.]
MSSDNIIPMPARVPDQALIDMIARIRTGLIHVHAQLLTIPPGVDVTQRACEYAARTGFAAGVAMMAIEQINAACPSLAKGNIHA